jgi:Uma2 family endonuclease
LSVAGIPEYWIIDLNTNCVEVRTQPEGSRYRSVTTYAASGEIPVALGGTSLGQIPVSNLLAA